MLTSIAEAPVRFSAPCHSSPVYGAARAEAVPHAGMSPPCPPVRGVCLFSPSLAAWRDEEGRPGEGFHGVERHFVSVSSLTVCWRRQQAASEDFLCVLSLSVAGSGMWGQW